MRARGLKLSAHRESDALVYVAPHAGAWIETIISWPPSRRLRWSRPMRARGLKHILCAVRLGMPSRAPCGRVD